MANSGKRLLTNAAANWVGFAAQMVIALILTPILLNALGEGRYGIWSLVESILAYLMLFDLGVAASIVRFVARFEAVRDRHNLNRVFSTSLAIFTVAGMLALAAALTIALGFLHRFKIPPEMVADARWMLILLGCNLAFGLPLGIFPSILDGLEKYPVKTAFRTGALVLRSLLFLIIAANGGGLIELAWTITICNLIEHLAMMVMVWRYLPELRFSFGLIDRETFRSIRGYSLNAFLGLLAGRISFQTNALVLGAFLGPQFIAFFVLAARLVEYAKNALRSITSVLTPAISSLDAQGDHDAIRRILLNATRYVLWLILPIQAGLMILGKPFLSVWVGEERAEMVYPTLAILSLPLTLAMMQSVSTRILYGLGQLQWFVRVVIIEAVANLLLSILLAQPLGIEGVAWATTVPNLFANLAIILHVGRILGVSAGEYLRRSFLRPGVVALLLAGGWLLVKMRSTIDSWPELLLVGLVGVACYAMLAGVVELGPAALRERIKRRFAVPSVSR